VNLYRAGREYIKWPYTADGPLSSAEVNVGGTWYPATITETQVQILAAGPDATGNPDGTVVLALGPNPCRIRFDDEPEIVVRNAGTIVVPAD
jgi:hypothetical protein